MMAVNLMHRVIHAARGPEARQDLYAAMYQVRSLLKGPVVNPSEPLPTVMARSQD